jgi:hypothetical protein
MQSRWVTLLLLSSLPLVGTGCGDRGHDHAHGDHDHEHGDHEHGDHEHGDHEHGHDEGSDHRHEPTRGGTLIELGDHVAHVELVLDAQTGQLTLFSLDAHAEQPVRLAAPGLAVELETPGGPLALTLVPRASALTGETVGDTSEFALTDPRLVGLAELRGRIPVLETRGQRFEAVAFPQQP